eukprot:16446881-Heterocapsa_arctica.AAC.1
MGIEGESLATGPLVAACIRIRPDTLLPANRVRQHTNVWGLFQSGFTITFNGSADETVQTKCVCNVWRGRAHTVCVAADTVMPQIFLGATTSRHLGRS